MVSAVAIDNGYWATKVYTANNQFSFRSRYERTINETLNNNDTMAFKYDGVDYLVGEGAGVSNVEYDKTSTELHKICTYAALSRLANCTGTDFNIVVGYPLNIYSSNKEAFAEYLKTDDLIETELNGELKLFKVSNVTVFPQGAGALYVNPGQYKSRVIAVLDIGGLTVNGCIFDNLTLVRESIFTENLGTIILQNKVKKILDKHYNMNIQEYELPGIIKNGLIKYQQESRNFIDAVLLNHIEDIKKTMRVNNWNIDNLEILLTGGGSLLMEKQLKDIFPLSVMSADPVNDNVKGFYNIGRMVYGA
jgi:plasmid segregation protein ParM